MLQCYNKKFLFFIFECLYYYIENKRVIIEDLYQFYDIERELKKIINNATLN